MVCPWLKGGAWYCNDPEGGEGTGRIARELLLIQQLHDHLVKHVWRGGHPVSGKHFSDARTNVPSKQGSSRTPPLTEEAPR